MLKIRERGISSATDLTFKNDSHEMKKRMQQQVISLLFKDDQKYQNIMLK